MKLTISGEQARRLKTILEDTTNPQLQDLVRKLDQGLQPGPHLTGDELAALVTVATDAANTAGPAVIRIVGHLRQAIPKLETMRAKQQAREEREPAGVQ
jgi:hypothetical protein